MSPSTAPAPPRWPTTRARRARTQRVADGVALEAADLDGDGTVSAAGFRAGADASVDHLDRNEDGGVTHEDFRPQP